MKELERITLTIEEKQIELEGAIDKKCSPKELAKIRDNLNESKIKRVLLEIRDYWSSKTDIEFDPDLSRKLDVIESLLA